ncbi:MAG TPA: hypothetical protein VF312_05455, partial [Propionibacteriaceae bacterium]
MPGDLDDVVRTADDPEVAVGVLASRVTREVLARVRRPVRLHVPLGILVERPHHRRPGVLEDEEALVPVRHVLPLLVEDLRFLPMSCHQRFG